MLKMNAEKKNMHRVLRIVSLCTGLLLSTPASAVNFGLEVAGGLVSPDPTPHFQLTANLQQVLASRFSLGFRGGLGLNVTPGVTLLVPLDLFVDIGLSPRFGLEAGGGLWLVPNTYALLRAHFGGGFRANFYPIQLSLHVGYLQPGVVALARVTYFF
jgi:hypothetical protein